MTQSVKRGFTMTDTIVACLCLGSMLAIGLPSLQVNRERARTTRCADRMRTILFASHSFHDAMKRLPPATIGAGSEPTLEQWLARDSDNYWKNFQNTSSLALLMPFMELNDKYDRVSPVAFDIYRNLTEHVDADGQRLYSWQGDIPGASDVAMTFEEACLCPSDNINETDMRIVVATQPVKNEQDPHDDIGVQYWDDASQSKSFGRTNYSACGGVMGGYVSSGGPEAARWRGCMTSGHRVTLETIRDGTSRTIMYGETNGQIEDSERTAACSWFWSGFSRGRGDIDYFRSGADAVTARINNPDRKMIGDGTWSSLYGFGSMHPGGMYAGFADGSVHFLSRDINWETWYELCGARDGGIPRNYDAIPQLPARTPDESEPLVEKFLVAGELDDGETFLKGHLQFHPDDDQARFGLGVLQFFQTVEHLGQSLYRYGAGANQDSSMMVQAIPFMRMPVPPNPNPDPVGMDEIRQTLQTVIDDLQKADQTLAEISSDNVKLPLNVGRFHLDINGDGVCVEEEGLSPILQFYTGGLRGRRGAVAGQVDDLVIAFDKADVYWLRGYCHLLSAMAETLLAYDLEPVWDVFGHRLFAKAQVPYEFLTRDGERRSQLDYELILDAVAAIHNVNFQLAEADRMPRALEHLNTVIAQSRLNWDAILAETDDDYEWIPGPNQEGVFPNARITQEMVDTWQDFLDEAQSLLSGDKLAPFWRGTDRTLGVNLNKVFTEPRPFDLVLWIHGSAAAPYLENGEVTQPETWRRFQQVFRGNFLGFAIWFN